MFKYVFRPYDPIYTKLFAKEKDRLKKFLGNDILIEHVGSTSIPGMGVKGIIDMAVAADFQNDLSDFKDYLKTHPKDFEKYAEIIKKATKYTD